MKEAPVVEPKTEPTHEELIARLDDPMWLLRRAYHILDQRLGESAPPARPADR